MLYKEFEKNREDILENEFCMQSDASTLPITDCPSYPLGIHASQQADAAQLQALQARLVKRLQG